MSKVIRALVALTLMTGLVATRAAAAPQPEGASSSYFVVDVVVRGTPPPGASIKVLVPDATTEDAQERTIDLAEASGTEDAVMDVGTVSRHLFVDPDNDADADAIRYACQMTGVMTAPHPDSFCEPRTAPQPPAPGTHVYAEFWGNVNQAALVTITVTFGICDTKPVTVFLGAGDTPTAGNDVIAGTPGVDTINGLGGDDRICGRGGNDTLRGGAGRDRLLGENGADRLEGGLLGDTLLAGAGADTLFGQGGNDALDGGAQSDSCNGGTEQDTAVRCEVKSSIP
jgi:RTX calcium-binding nonapeptide repeat (4 copies)